MTVEELVWKLSAYPSNLLVTFVNDPLHSDTRISMVWLDRDEDNKLGVRLG